MTNTTVRFQVTQKEVDDNSNTYNENEYSFVVGYTFYTKQEFTLDTGNIWHPINFGQVTTSSAIKIGCDQPVFIKMDNGSDSFQITDGMIFVGEITALSIKNNSGSTVTLSVQIYGE